MTAIKWTVKKKWVRGRQNLRDLLSLHEVRENLVTLQKVIRKWVMSTIQSRKRLDHELYLRHPG